MGTTLLAALNWDPQIRGFLIILTAFIILPGSVYMLLATNTGAKLGFLIAAAGFFGWMMLMSWIWVVYGIGIKGEQPFWQVEEVVPGNVAERGTVEEAAGFPKGWRVLPPGDPILGDATSTADRVLSPSTALPAEGEAPVEVEFEPVFDSAADYVVLGGYARGGENYWIPGGGVAAETGIGNPGTNPFDKVLQRLRRGPFHSPHYAVVQVQQVIPQVNLGGAPPRPVADATQAPVSVIMVRNQGSLRFPNVLVAVSMTILFALVASTLHRRDKAIMASRSSARPGATATA